VRGAYQLLDEVCLREPRDEAARVGAADLFFDHGLLALFAGELG
jgi:hypothetical protein